MQSLNIVIVTIYISVNIAGGIYPIITSLISPPPIDVMLPITITPKKSKRDFIATSASDIENDTVPKISHIVKNIFVQANNNLF